MNINPTTSYHSFYAQQQNYTNNIGKQNTQIESVVTDNTNILTEKMKQIALTYALVADATDNKDSGSSMYLNMLLIGILFGNNEPQPLSPAEQADMINEIISSGQTGAISKVMGSTNPGTYSPSGAGIASAPIGGMVSVTA